MKWHLGLAMVCLLTPAVELRADVPTTAPSADELHLLFSQAKYPELLQELRVALAPSDKPSADQVDLLKLRGEAMLRTKDDTGAADAFAQAARECKNEDEASTLRATAFLVKQSHQEMYVPKTGEKGAPTSQPAGGSSVGGISIIETSSRKQAFEALLQDQLSLKKTQIDSAKKATSLPPIMSIAPTVGQISDIERAATGSTTKSAEMTKSLGEHSRELIGTAITKMGGQIDQITKKVQPNQNQTHTQTGTRTQSRTRVRTALTSDEAGQLKQIESTCDDIKSACTALGKALGKDGGDFAAASKSADDLKKRAADALKHDGAGTGLSN